MLFALRDKLQLVLFILGEHGLRDRGGRGEDPRGVVLFACSLKDCAGVAEEVAEQRFDVCLSTQDVRLVDSVALGYKAEPLDSEETPCA